MPAEGRRRTEGLEAPPVGRSSTSRTVAAVSAGLLAAVVVLQSALMAGVPGNSRQYDQPEKDDDDGIGTAASVAIGVGAAGAVAVATGVIGGGAAAGAAAGAAVAAGAAGSATLLGGATVMPVGARRQIDEWRLVVSRPAVSRGSRFVADLQGRPFGENRWYSVTPLPETTVEVVGGNELVTPVPETKNVFSVPLSAPGAESAREVTIVARYAPEGGAVVERERTVTVRAGGR